MKQKYVKVFEDFDDELIDLGLGKPQVNVNTPGYEGIDQWTDHIISTHTSFGHVCQIDGEITTELIHLTITYSNYILEFNYDTHMITTKPSTIGIYNGFDMIKLINRKTGSEYIADPDTLYNLTSRVWQDLGNSDYLSVMIKALDDELGKLNEELSDDLIDLGLGSRYIDVEVPHTDQFTIDTWMDNLFMADTVFGKILSVKGKISYHTTHLTITYLNYILEFDYGNLDYSIISGAKRGFTMVKLTSKVDGGIATFDTNALSDITRTAAFGLGGDDFLEVIVKVIAAKCINMDLVTEDLTDDLSELGLSNRKFNFRTDDSDFTDEVLARWEQCADTAITDFGKIVALDGKVSKTLIDLLVIFTDYTIKFYYYQFTVIGSAGTESKFMEIIVTNTNTNTITKFDINQLDSVNLDDFSYTYSNYLQWFLDIIIKHYKKIKSII